MRSDSIQDNLVNKYFLSPQELAVYFGVSLKTIYRRIENREIPFYKIGRSIRFKKEESLCKKKECNKLELFQYLRSYV